MTEETASSTSVSSFAPTTSASLEVAELSFSSPPELSSTTTACSFPPVATASASLTRTSVSTGTKWKSTGTKRKSVVENLSQSLNPR